MDLALLADWNTHWGGAPVSELVLRHPRARAPVRHMVRELLEPDGPSWSLRPGPRQIGKTTSLGHVAQGLLDAGVDPRRIIIAPLDQQPIQSGMRNDLQRLIAGGLERRAANRSEPLFLLLDEVQELPDWDVQLKTAWDRYHDRVRALATGSSALRLSQTRGASLAGRVKTTRMFTMKFREVLEAHPQRAAFADEETWQGLEKRARDARAAFLGPAADLRDNLEELRSWLAARPAFDEFLVATFFEYCVWGGYPAVRPGCGRSGVARLEFFEATWGSVAASDLPHAGVRDVLGLRRLFASLAANTGGKFVPTNLAKRLETKRDTVVAWKALLEELFVVQQLPPLDQKLKPAPGRDKAYVLDPGWWAYWHNVLDHAAVLDRPEMGMLIETVLVDHLRRLRYNLTHSTAGGIGFVQDPEVDACFELVDRWLLVEVKSGGGQRAPQGLLDAGTDRDLRIVASRRRSTLQDDKVWTIPAYVLALIC